MYQERELLPISALQHLLYCERQCALIHIEQCWAENLYTAEGKVMHDKVHDEDSETRGNIRICRSLELRSLRLGLVGKADVVEFHKIPSGGRIPFPVEYKRGKPKVEECDRIQLCAQALCLEEMLQCRVSCGALYYGKTKHRTEVNFDETIRNLTEKTAISLHELISSGHTPVARYSSKCDNCSFLNFCLPKICKGRGSAVANYLKKVRQTSMEEI